MVKLQASPEEILIVFMVFEHQYLLTYCKQWSVLLCLDRRVSTIFQVSRGHTERGSRTDNDGQFVSKQRFVVHWLPLKAFMLHFVQFIAAVSPISAGKETNCPWDSLVSK